MKHLLAVLLLIASPALATDYKQLVNSTVNKVVTIHVSGIGKPEPNLVELLTGKEPEERPIGYLGSGSIMSEDGIILTCDHLFRHPLKERKIIVELTSGVKLKALILDEDKTKDLATLKIFPLHKLQHFVLGQPLHVGQDVASFGSPLGWQKTVTFGHVENLNLNDSDRPRTLHGAAINPGNSGGPLVDTTGHLVGVNIESMRGMEALHLSVTLKDIHSFLGE